MCPINDTNNPGETIAVEEICLVSLSFFLCGGETYELLDYVDVCKGVDGLGDGSADGGL